MTLMKVLMLAPEPFFEPRGTPISVYQRLRALSSLGYQVDLLTYHVGEDVSIPNVRIIRIPNIPFVKKVKIGPSWAKPILDFFMLLHAIILIPSGNYDVIHSHEEASYIAMLLARIFRITHLYDMHSSLPEQLKNFKFGNWSFLIKLFQILEKSVLKTCDAVITIDKELEMLVKEVNPDVYQLVIENLPIYDDSSFLSAEDDNIQPINDKRTIVYTGTFESYQGLELLIESIPLIKKAHSQAFFVLVGGQPDQVEALRKLVSHYALENDISFIGIVSPEKALKYLDIAEILVSPRTVGTSVPLKIYSYLHSGKPIVATRIPAHTQVLNDDTALLVEPVKESLANGIIGLLDDPESGQRIGICAQQLSTEHYSPDHYAEKVAKIYGWLAASMKTKKPHIRSLEF